MNKDGVITAKAFDADKFHSQSLEMYGYQHEVTGINALCIEHMSLLDTKGVMVLHDYGDAHSRSSSMSATSTMSDMFKMLLGFVVGCPSRPEMLYCETRH